MKRSSNATFRSITILGTAMSLSACNGMFESIYDDPIESKMEIKDGTFSQINTTEYTNWVYIDLSGSKATTVAIGEEHDNEIPKEWDFAIHRYDLKTNGGAAYQTAYTSLDELNAVGKLPEAATFTEDKWTTDKVAIDMSGMMEGNIVYVDSYRNALLSGWLNVDTSTMPPIYTMSSQVYVIRLKDNTYAAIRFIRYTNARGVKGYIDFDYIYPLEIDEENNEAANGNNENQ